MKKTTTKIKLTALMLTMGSALVILLCSCEDSSEDYQYNRDVNIEPLTISPAEVTLTTEETFTVLTAVGGTPPFSWSVSDSSLGSLPDSNAATVTYTRKSAAYGANVVTVTDNNKWSSQCIVNQNIQTNSPSS